MIYVPRPSTYSAMPKEENKYVNILYKIICDRETPMASLKLIKNLHNTLKLHGSADNILFWQGVGARTPGMQEIIARSRSNTLNYIVQKYYI